MNSCSSCRKPQNEVRSLTPTDDGGFLCDKCAPKQRERIPRPIELKAMLDEHVIDQDKAKRDVSLAIYNHYRRRDAVRNKVDTGGVEIQKSNVLLVGPTGSGKTEIARVLARKLNVPFHVADATTLTQAGYVGDDVETILQGLISAAGENLDRARWGIVLLDEIDKLARKSGRGATGYRDVNGEGVQQALLKLFEGSIVKVPVAGASRTSQGYQMLDTTNILFIAAGSFAGIEGIVSARRNKAARVGFGGMSRHDVSTREVYEDITYDDVLEFGIIPEMLGRLPVITSTTVLSRDALVRILTEPKNAIVKQLKALFALDGILLEFSPAALEAIADKAIRLGTGARALRTILEAVIADVSFEVRGDPEVREVHVTESNVVNRTPIAVMREEVRTG